MDQKELLAALAEVLGEADPKATKEAGRKRRLAKEPDKTNASLTVDDVRQEAEERAKAKGSSGVDGASPIKATVNKSGSELTVKVDLSRPWVRHGTNKAGEAWATVLFASTVKSRFLKTIPVERPGKNRLRLQIVVSEELPK